MAHFVYIHFSPPLPAVKSGGEGWVEAVQSLILRLTSVRGNLIRAYLCFPAKTNFSEEQAVHQSVGQNVNTDLMSSNRVTCRHLTIL
jgi:hypothetical protein